jgi:YfiH family protein
MASVVPDFIIPNWSAPARVRALTTTRIGGRSAAPYAAFNLGDHVGDDPAVVAANRQLLRGVQMLPSEPIWLKQVHGVRVVDAAADTAGASADGAYTDQREVVIAIMTADCLPIFLCDRRGEAIALLHAGWRGLASGVIDVGVQAMGIKGERLLAHLGPAIGPSAYEVGDDVHQAFVQRDPGAARAFRDAGAGHWMADLYELARRRLSALGVTQITGGEHCTFRDERRFFSYRRDGVTGRMASLIWLE